MENSELKEAGRKRGISRAPFAPLVWWTFGAFARSGTIEDG